MARGVVWNERWLPDAVKLAAADVKSWLFELRYNVEEYEDWIDQYCKSRISTSESSLHSFDSNCDHFSLNKYFSAEEGSEDKSDYKEQYATAFDDILSNLGNEIYQLETYQSRHEAKFGLPADLGRSIMRLFDDCIDQLKEEPGEVMEIKQIAKKDSTESIDSDLSEEEGCVVRRSKVNRDHKKHLSCDINYIFDRGEGVPVPPKRKNRQRGTDNFNAPKPRPTCKLEQLKIKMDRNDLRRSNGKSLISYANSDSDSGNNSPSADYSDYQNLWNCSSGRKPLISKTGKILKEQYGVINTISLDSVRDLSNSTLDISKHRVVISSRPGRLPNSDSFRSDRVKHRTMAFDSLRVPVDDWNTRRPCVDSKRYSYDDRKTIQSSSEMVHCTSECDLTDECHRSLSAKTKKSNSFVYAKAPENIYENIDFIKRQNIDTIKSYTSSVDDTSSVEIISDSDSWRTPMGQGRTSTSTEYISESPIYENLLELQFAPIPQDVLSWRAVLLDPYWNDDEEDQWVSVEKASEFNEEHHRPPPYVIPRIKPFKPKTLTFENQPNNDEPKSPSIKEVRKRFEEGFNKPHESPKSKSPPKVGVPNEPFSGKFHCGVENSPVMFRKNLDVSRSGKSKSMVTPKQELNFVKVLPNLHDTMAYPICDGTMSRANLTMNGKKVRKNWQHNYAVLTQTSLFFYKDKKTYEITRDKDVAKANSVNPEAVVPLNGALISVSSPQQTSRSNALVVTSSTHNQHLIHHDDPEKILYWHNMIVTAINRLPSNYVCPDKMPPVNLAATPSPTNKHASRTKTKAYEGSVEDLTDLHGNAVNRSKLMKLFSRRPTIDSLIKKGIYKDEPVFGRNLEQVCPDANPRVPEFVIRCVKAIESNVENMKTDGLYRASGNLSQVQKLRLEADQNNFNGLDKEVDVHVLTGALKLFFRELKEPLVPFKFFQKCLDASCGRTAESRIKEFREIIDNFPDCNRQTLRFILEHLLRVTALKEHNRMHITNIAIVLGPTLLWAESLQNMALDCLQQNRVIEILMNDFDKIFKDDHRRK